MFYRLYVDNIAASFKGFLGKSLSRNLNTLDGTAVVIANVIGVGIFTVSGFVYESVPDHGLFMLLWIVGGALSLIGGNAYARLAIKYPQAGGEYLYLNKSMGALVGFLSGWTSFIAGFSGAIAASAVGLSAYIGRVVAINNTTGLIISISAVVIITILHVTGVKKGNTLNHFLNGLLVTTFLILCIKGLITPSEISTTTADEVSAPNFFVALIPILFTFAGWNAAVYLVEEFKNPEKSIYKAVLGGTLVVVILYLLINFLYIKFIPVNELSQTIEVGHLLGNKLFGDLGSLIVNSVIITALLSSISAMIMAGPRVYFAMARDGLFFKQLSVVHPKFDTPTTAIIAQSGWSILLILTGSFEDILLYTGFSIILFSALAVMSVFLLKNNLPAIPIIWQVLYGIFILVSFTVLINSFATRTTISLVGTALISLGIPIFYWMKKTNQ